MAKKTAKASGSSASATRKTVNSEARRQQAGRGLAARAHVSPRARRLLADHAAEEGRNAVLHHDRLRHRGRVAQPERHGRRGEEHHRRHEWLRGHPGGHARALRPRVRLRDRARPVRREANARQAGGGPGLVRLDRGSERCARQPAAARSATRRKQKLAALVAARAMRRELPAWSTTSTTCSAFSAWRRARPKPRATAKVAGTGPAMEFVGGLAPVRYCRPTDKPITLPEVEGVRIYVLGPPPDEKIAEEDRLQDRSLSPRRIWARRSRSSWRSRTPSRPSWSVTSRSSRRPATRSTDMNNPGSSSGSGGDRHLQFFSDHYFGPRRGAKDEDKDQSWRRIDAAYMDAAAEFALQLDSATNNTSLVLALELIDSGKVLLFVADAQVGNWLSWQNVQWTARRRPPPSRRPTCCGGRSSTRSATTAATTPPPRPRDSS